MAGEARLRNSSQVIGKVVGHTSVGDEFDVFNTVSNGLHYWILIDDGWVIHSE